VSEREASLRKAVGSLREYVEEPIVTKRDVAGVIQGFELAVELLWKCLQDRVIQAGLPERGPKPVVRAAIRAGWLPESQEEAWRELLVDRTLANDAHSPECTAALVERIQHRHLGTIERAVQSLREVP
jgi:nucleotidyltransferase substrate binding protein (TIGR01987 family)